MLTLKEAKESRRCRVCGERIAVGGGPAGWMEDFGEMVYPVRVTLDFGREFSHTACLAVPPPKEATP